MATVRTDSGAFVSIRIAITRTSASNFALARRAVSGLTLLPVTLMAVVLGSYFTWLQQSELESQLLTLMTLQNSTDPLAAARGEHCWQGILLTLASRGLGAALFNLQPLNLSQRCRALLQLDLAHPWQAAELAARLGLSESSLRRGLRQEQSSFSTLLSELRLACAFNRVMTEATPLLAIALDCGFASASRFSQNFRQRFGMSPSALRQSRGLHDEGIGDEEPTG